MEKLEFTENEKKILVCALSNMRNTIELCGGHICINMEERYDRDDLYNLFIKLGVDNKY